MVERSQKVLAALTYVLVNRRTSFGSSDVETGSDVDLGVSVVLIQYYVEDCILLRDISSAHNSSCPVLAVNHIPIKWSA